jgi:hypothetical protein
MTAKKGPAHVVVDGSNIATEGRSLPSLTQLNEAVMSYMAEHPDTAITVVVDATFGHRIDKKEAAEFEEGISNNELVSPPAGAVGRGDAFVLGIADKANATILSNDSFQEFHGDYKWLFDEGRLVGGKPVPHVGWVFVDRVPVRGPVSRQATGGARRGRSQSKSGSGSGAKSSRSGARSSKAANQPMPVPSEPPPGAKSTTASDEVVADAKRAPRGGEPVNELLPFLEFVEHHPIGTSINGTVDAYSSHGAYIAIGDDRVRGYIPLRLMSDPPPRSARQEMKLGESVTAVVTSFAAARRSIDCALPDMASKAIAEAAEASDEPSEQAKQPTAKKQTAKKATAKKAAAKKPAAKKQAAKKTTAKKATAKKSTAKDAAAEKTPAEKPAATKSAANKTTAKTQVAKKTAAKKSTAKKSTAKKSTAKKSTAKKTAAKKSTAKKSVAKKSVAADAPATGAD